MWVQSWWWLISRRQPKVRRNRRFIWNSQLLKTFQSGPYEWNSTGQAKEDLQIAFWSRWKYSKMQAAIWLSSWCVKSHILMEPPHKSNHKGKIFKMPKTLVDLTGSHVIKQKCKPLVFSCWLSCLAFLRVQYYCGIVLRMVVSSGFSRGALGLSLALGLNHG